jgi:hypothetical protein
MVNTWKEETNDIVKSFFMENLSSFSLTNDGSYAPHWIVEYVSNEILVRIGGDVGFSIDIYIYGSKYSLWQYDRSVNQYITTSVENIQYQLNVLKRFLNEVGY